MKTVLQRLFLTFQTRKLSDSYTKFGPYPTEDTVHNVNEVRSGN
jgi:hypothetical protein